MERSRIYGNRVLAFQRTTFSKNSRDLKPLMQSEYYNYDRRWEFDDLPTPSETVSYTGASCINPPPPTGCQDIYECTDCYSFKYTTQEALLANVPLNYCAWSLDQFGNMVICPIGQVPTTFYPNATEVYCNTGVVDGQSSKVKALQPAAALNNTLMLRSVTIQLDTINNTQDNDFYLKRLDTKNDYIVDFYMGGSKEEDEYGFNNPVKMLMPFDNLTVRTILERNRYLQPELEKNQVELKTRYYYNISQNIWNVNSNCASEGSYSSTVNTNIGLPVRITVGWDRSEGDSLATQYEYNEIGMVKKVIEPSGKFMEYNFDNFWRLIEVKENGNRLLMNNEYHTWNKDNSLTFSEKTNQNYVLNRIYNGALIIDANSDNIVDNQDVIDANNKDKIEFRKGFVDPLGREHSSIKAYSVGNKMFEIHSGMFIRDNWSRTISNHKNHQVIITLGQETPLGLTNNNLNAYSGFIYENDPKSRAKRSSNFGVDVNDLHVVRSNYAIANNIFTSCELGLNLRELQLIMGTGSTSAYRFYRTETYDQDNKVSIEYINAVGQKVATLSYSDNNTKIVTLFVYDSYGNLTRVINPEKQQSQYHFNMIGQLVKETTVDAGTKAYMYNKQGLVSVMQDELGNGQMVGSTPKPYYRIFKYDDFGRVVAVGRTDQFELETKYPVYNSNYHPLLYETTFVGDGPDIPTIIGNEPFYFDYLYTNISSQDWLAQYKGMVGTMGGGGNLSYTPGNITGFGTQFKLINPIILEKETIYGTDALVSTIGKIIITHSYNNDGDLIQRISYSYDGNDNLSQQTIQFHPTNHLGSNPSTPPAGTTTSVITYPSYNYRNSLLEEKVDVDNNGTVDLHYFNEYDVLNRLVAVYAASAQVSDKAQATKLISYVYDDANGLLIEKKQHVEGGANPAEVASIAYNFDVRDRLTAISALNAGNQLMNYQLFYDDNSPSYIDMSNSTVETVNHHKNWNGNINGSLMQYTFSGATNAVSNFNDPTLYGFRYDGINRLTEADATVGDFIVSGTAQEVLNSYQIGDESMTYDKIGNIKTMLRVLKNVQIQPTDPYISFDHFNYNYQAGNNRLMSVTGLSGSQSRIYTYDANGNLLTDNYKGITSTIVGRSAYTYNMVKNGEAITYLYSASDLRIYKKVVTSSGTTEEYYLMDGMGKTIAIKNMQNNSWEYFLSAGEREARLKPLDGLAKFKPDEVQFFAYDHLGNTRMTYTPIATASGINLQIDYVADYYPYGKVLREFANGQTERYLTTQHERDGETGLDYRGARYYDSDVARFLSIDPLSAQFPGWSSYNYVMGNPVINIDEDGRSASEFIRRFFPVREKKFTDKFFPDNGRIIRNSMSEVITGVNLPNAIIQNDMLNYLSDNNRITNNFTPREITSKVNRVNNMYDIKGKFHFLGRNFQKGDQVQMTVTRADGTVETLPTVVASKRRIDMSVDVNAGDPNKQVTTIQIQVTRSTGNNSNYRMKRFLSLEGLISGISNKPISNHRAKKRAD
jgi:RHS repeat-associated protein